MIVYGDPAYRDSLQKLILLQSIRVDAALRASTCQSDHLDRLRDLLISAGELEQSAEDEADLNERVLLRLREVTNQAASAFHAAWAERADSARTIAEALSATRCPLHALGQEADWPVRVKVPEGFAFYTLFPEQYAAAALRWAKDHAARRAESSVAVIGVRSIGTSLSAVVRAALASDGWNVHRFTLRPGGHPFQRRVELAPARLRGATFAVVVDEGPGASGSSMAAVARAVVEAGIEPSRVSFFPGHDGEPGPNASDEVRGWWRRIDRHVVPLDQLRWQGRSMIEQLAEHTTRLMPTTRVERIDDLSGGLWRDALDRSSSARPPAFPAFERTKYRCVMGDGSAVLWKFAGLGGGAERTLQALHNRARGGWTPAPLGAAFGFIATPWVDGTPLTPEDVSDDLIARMGRYIRESAGPALLPDEQSGPFDRLRGMLYWNAWESLGKPLAEATRHLSDAAAEVQPRQPVLSYGDGRFGPYEWIRSASGRIFKVDCAGHDADHTMIGKQPLDWDIAGAIVEWGLDPNRASELQAAAGSTGTPHARMDCFCASYAAFRIGMASMCGVDATPYRDRLETILRRWG